MGLETAGVEFLISLDVEKVLIVLSYSSVLL